MSVNRVQCRRVPWLKGRAHPNAMYEERVRCNAKVHVAAWERMACGAAVNVEFQLLCVTQ